MFLGPVMSRHFRKIGSCSTAKERQPVAVFLSIYIYIYIKKIPYMNRNPTAAPAKRIAVGSSEKARPAYEKALRPFHRLRAFSEL